MSNEPKRYIQGLWSHIFETNGPDVTVKLCYDTQQEKLIAMQVEQDSFRPATRAELADVEDSLKTANDDALSNPADHGLETSDSLPLWAGPGRKRLIAIIDFDDPEDNIANLPAAATWLECALGEVGNQVDVTTYDSLADALADATDAVAEGN